MKTMGLHLPHLCIFMVGRDHINKRFQGHFWHGICILKVINVSILDVKLV